MISISGKGNFSRTSDFLNRLLHGNLYSDLDNYGRQGVNALANATPVRTGLTAQSWKYKIVRTRGRTGIEWYNTDVVSGTSVAILIQYGHGTGTGGYVEGRDFINPAIRPIFDKISDDVWKKVRS